MTRRNQRKLWNCWKKVNEVENTTIVMVTHDSTIVDRYKKRTICLEEGYVVADIMKGGYLKHD